MSIEDRFDISFIAELALREKQIQQNYRPIIAVHKWFARRPGTLFRGLLLSEFGDGSLRDLYYNSNSFPDKRIADPFMGGGTPLIEANRLGCNVAGWDVNPMAWWIVRQEIEHLDLVAYRQEAEKLIDALQKDVGSFYQTRCACCGDTKAPVKYFLWVKSLACHQCGGNIDLSPGCLIAEDRRHPKNVLICMACGHLAEVADRHHPGACPICGKSFPGKAPASRSSCLCSSCGTNNVYPRPSDGVPRHRLIAMEYYCPRCHPKHQGRFFKAPDGDDLKRFREVERQWKSSSPQFVPEDAIPPGDETDRLHRWGYRQYRDMFNARQLLGLEHSARIINAVHDEKVRNALATNFSDLLRYQNMLCRYDTMALKSLDIFSVHGFPVGLMACESNLLGIRKGDGACVGSGGWTNIVDKFMKAKAYCDAPFEIKHLGGVKTQIPIREEWIGECRVQGGNTQVRELKLHASSSTDAVLPDASLDAVFTDPPYFGNVQYAELMDFCYAWLRKLVSPAPAAFHRMSTRNQQELTGNVTMDRDLSHFTEGISSVFSRMSRALKPGAPLAFTYHHNKLDAYFPLVVAILDAGLTCTATLPCPAEMGASIHISGTGSSIVDTVFVCRSTGRIRRHLILSDLNGIANLVRRDLGHLEEASVKPTSGDTRCIIYGHFVRLAIWKLRQTWSPDSPINQKLKMVECAIKEIGELRDVESRLNSYTDDILQTTRMRAGEETIPYEVEDAVSF